MFWERQRSACSLEISYLLGLCQMSGNSQGKTDVFFFFVNAYHHLIFYKAEPGDNLVSTFGIVTAVKVTVTLQGH